MEYASTTKYEAIYKDSYWGSHRTYHDAPPKTIIDTRNQFIEKYQIVKRIDPSYDVWKLNDNLDHQEFYEDVHGRIVHIYSQHHAHSAFKTIPSMYAPNQITGLKLIETRKSRKLLMKTIFDKLPDDIGTIIKEYIKKSKTLSFKKIKQNLRE